MSGKNTTVGMNQLAYYLANFRGKILVSDIEHSSSLLPFIDQEGQKRTNEQYDLEDADRLASAVKEIAENGFEHYNQIYSMNRKTGDWKPT